MKKQIFIIAASLLLAATARAQGPKIGYVNSQELLLIMPEITKADNDLKSFAKSYQDQLETMGKEMERKGKEFQAGEKTMTDAVKEVKYKELQDLNARIESTQQSAQEKIAERKKTLYSPILEKADKAIKDVAKENSYDYVLDGSSGSVLYATDKDNLMDKVKAKLGIKATAAPAVAKP